MPLVWESARDVWMNSGKFLTLSHLYHNVLHLSSFACQPQQRPRREQIPAPLLNPQSPRQLQVLQEGALLGLQTRKPALHVLKHACVYVLMIRGAVNSLCSPKAGDERCPAFPSLLPEQPHTFRDEPFPKKPYRLLFWSN